MEDNNAGGMYNDAQAQYARPEANPPEKAMQQLTDFYSQDRYTTVYAEKDFSDNAPHEYTIRRQSGNGLLGEVKFQAGPIVEAGVNGVMNENLIAIVIDRISQFQKSTYSCRENALALTHLQEAMHWLKARTAARELRGVEGTHTV